MKLLRRIGFYLFVLSFPLPNWGFEGTGIGIFIMTPWAVSHMVANFFHFYEWNEAVLAIGFSMGWLANFTVFLPLPRWARWVSIFSPWIAFFSDVFLRHYNSGTVTSGSLDIGMLTFIPFYPWAVGISLIHYSRLKEAKRFSDYEPSSGEATSHLISDAARTEL